MDEEIKKLLQENLEMNKKIYKICRKLNNYMVWSQVYSFLKILIIVVPLILGYYYLMPLIKNAFTPYNELLGGSSQDSLNQMLQNGLKNINPQNLQIK